MKKLGAILGLMLGFAPSLYAQEQQTVYDLSTSYEPTLTDACMVGEKPMGTVLNEYYDNKVKELEARNTGSVGSGHYSDFTITDIIETVTSYPGCRGTISYSYSTSTVYESGLGSKKTNHSYYNANGQMEKDASCPSSDNPVATIPKYNENGALMGCYDAQELADNDSCPDTFNHEKSIIPNNEGKTASNICSTEDDGSRCAYTLSADSTYYQSTFENTQCYAQPVDEDPFSKDEQFPTTDEFDCIGNFCPAQPENHCDSQGLCDEGCGNINGQFYCPKEKLTESEQPTPTPPECNPAIETCEGETEEPGEGENQEPGEGETEECPEGETCEGGNGEPTVNIDTSKLEQLLTAPANQQFQQNNQLKAIQDQKMQEAENRLLSAMGQSAEEAGFALPDRSQLGQLDTLFGTLAKSSCQNPTNKWFTLDFCSKAPVINEWLYWIFAALTIIACWHKVLDILKG